MGLFYGVVSIVTGDEQHNVFFYGLAASADEFSGRCLRAARDRHPRGPVVNQAANEIPAETIREAAAELDRAARLAGGK